MKFCFALLLCLIVAVSSAKAGTDCGEPVTRPKLTGKARNGPTSLIWHGDEARKNSWPWHVHVKIYGYKDKRKFTICGGSVIDKHFMLTAASCFEALIKMKKTSEANKLVVVHFGAHNFQNSEERGKRIHPNQLIIHPKYIESLKIGDVAVRHVNNIALLVFNKPIEFDERVQPVCLPTVNVRWRRYAYAYENEAYIAGWGRDENWKTRGALRQTMQAIGNHVTCSDGLRDKWTTTQERIANEYLAQHVWFLGMLCGVRHGKPLSNVCYGDFGGGLVSQKESSGQWTILGVHSLIYIPLRNKQWADMPKKKKCEQSIPIYTNVFEQKEWIEEQTKTVYKK